MKLLLLLLAVGASAGTTTQPKDKAFVVYNQIKQSDKSASLVCPALLPDCVITWSAPAGKTVLFTDYKAEADKLKALAVKWRDGTITSAEKDVLLRALIVKFFGVEQ